MAELKSKVTKYVKINEETTLKFQKKYAVSKAAEVIQLFEKLSRKDPSAGIDIKKLRKKVLHNMVDRNKDKEPDQEYWSMQLLIKLGLIPDPDAEDEFKASMNDEERNEKLKEVGLFLPQKNLEELNKEM